MERERGHTPTEVSILVVRDLRDVDALDRRAGRFGRNDCLDEFRPRISDLPAKLAALRMRQKNDRRADHVQQSSVRIKIQFLAGGKQAQLNLDAHTALLDMIGTPVILLTHSQGGEFGWQIADARPKLVKAIITAEPAGPPIKGVDIAKIAYNQNANLSWGVTSLLLHYDPPVNDPSELQPVLEEKSEGPDVVPCYLQKEPAHKLVNLKDIPVLDVSGEASYHRVFDSCIAKWLNQAGVKTEYVKMEDAGLTGNEHEMMLDKNSDEIAKFFATWLDKHAH